MGGLTSSSLIKEQAAVGSTTYTIIKEGIYRVQCNGANTSFTVDNCTIVYNGANETGRQTVIVPLKVGAVCTLSCQSSSTNVQLYDFQ